MHRVDIVEWWGVSVFGCQVALCSGVVPRCAHTRAIRSTAVQPAPIKAVMAMKDWPSLVSPAMAIMVEPCLYSQQ